MIERMSFWQVLTTPLSWRCNGKVVDDRLAKRLLYKHRQRVAEVKRKKTQLTQQIVNRCHQADLQGVGLHTELLAAQLQRERLLRELLPVDTSGSDLLVFSSRTILDSYRICTEIEAEGMVFVTGIDWDGIGLATHLVEFPYAYRSVAGAAGEHQATHRIVIDTHEIGMRLLALIHSHPGSGPDSNHYSATDAQTQMLWERSSRMIGGIWSRDGYLRWYSLKQPYTVKIVGNHMEQIDENVWKISEEYRCADSNAD